VGAVISDGGLRTESHTNTGSANLIIVASSLSLVDIALPATTSSFAMDRSKKQITARPRVRLMAATSPIVHEAFAILITTRPRDFAKSDSLGNRPKKNSPRQSDQDNHVSNYFENE
jgi:hypothetical protein